MEMRRCKNVRRNPKENLSIMNKNFNLSANIIGHYSRI